MSQDPTIAEHTKPPALVFKKDDMIKSAIRELRAEARELPHDSLARNNLELIADTLMWVTNQHDECCTGCTHRGCEMKCHNPVLIVLKRCEAMRNQRKFDKIFHGDVHDRGI